MTLFTLLAKLTLDSSQFNSALEAAQSEADSFDMPDDQTLDVDTEPFDTAIDNSQEKADSFSGPDEQELALDNEPFETPLDESQENADSFEGPDEQELTLDNSEFDSALEESEAKSGTFKDSIGAVFTELKGIIVTTGVVALIGQVVSSLKEGVDLARQHGDTIDKQSQKLHLTAEAYQELDYALQLSGASVTDLTRAMRNFDEIQGGKVTDDQAAYFEKLGISAKDAGGNIKSAQQLMEETMYALADYTGEDRGLIMEAFFGKNSAGLNALLNQSSDQIKEMREEAHQLGLIMTDEEVKNAAAYNDAVTRLDSSVKSIKEEFSSNLLPLLTDAANTLASIVAFFNPRTKDKSLAEIMFGKESEYSESIATIEATASTAESLADKLLAMGDTGEMTATQYAIWEETANRLIDLVPSLGDVIDTETGQINGNSESIKENIKQWENLAKQKALQQLKEEKYQAILAKNKELIDKAADATTAAAEAETARKTAIGELNTVLEKRGYAAIDEAATMEEAYSQVGNVLASLGEYDTAYMLELTAAQNKWTKAVTAANEAQDKADKMQAELEEATANYQDWLTSIDTLFGTAETSADEATSEVSKLNDELNKLPAHKQVLIDVITQEGTGVAMPEAKGLWTVPYDNFPALLHRGERVLSAAQARHSGTDVDYEIVGAMIADTINSALRDVGLYMYGDKVGDMTSKRVDKNIRASSYSKQRAMGG